MTSAHTYAYTRTHTATHLTDVILGTLSSILADMNLAPGTLTSDWARVENAVKKWIEEGSLAAVRLECIQPNGTVAPIIEFPVAYDASGTGDIGFAQSTARVLRFLKKLERVPYGTTTSLFCTYNGYHTPMPGWGPGTLTDTSAMRTTNFGTLATGPGASTSMRIHGYR